MGGGATSTFRCPSCTGPVQVDSRFCPACGKPIDPGEQTPTEFYDVGTNAAADGPASTPGSSGAAGSSGHGGYGAAHRFAPGQVIAERYRVVGRLGRGGMGEVYRADDLKLGQPVALKFLWPALVDEEHVREKFYNEVRVARQVSHPNVCRVYDIGEVEGQPYISMEHIDGEDLASLLRRIGHLPAGKAVEIARQLCAGLAAAHDRGMLHRDLKPANVMIDGRGHVRITDFGLAGLAEEMREGDLRSGTPAYMAPEQLDGKEVSVKSDVYSLGLVLYEMFTGQPVYDAGTIAELQSLHETSTPATPSSHVEGVDPAAERVIVRCLEKDPRDRPESALAVAAALPGGDPLAAALAAGETPSPEMVAAAGVEGSLRPAVAVSLLAIFLLALAAFVPVARSNQLIPLLPLDKPRQVLLDRASQVLVGAGQPSDPADFASGFDIDTDYMDYLARDESNRDSWEALRKGRPAALVFWYRQSPRELQARGSFHSTISYTDPPQTISGMANVRLDPQGRLLELEIVPAQLEEQTTPVVAADWSAMFEAAGLDPEAFAETEPRWVPPVYSDTRVAWAGSIPELPGEEIRIEAASLGGQPVYFRLIGPWTRAERMVTSARVSDRRVQQFVIVSVILLVLATSVYMARRNLREGKGDRKGAMRLGLLVLSFHVGSWLLWGDHTAELNIEFGAFIKASGLALFLASIVVILYIALEPYVRRRFPERIISWTRLLGGKFKDPLVGRDILIGAAAGALVALLETATPGLARLSGDATAVPGETAEASLLGVGKTLGRLLFMVPDQIFGAMFITFLWFMLRRLLRIHWLADGVLLLFLNLDFLARGEWTPIVGVCSLLISVVLMVILVRFGLLALLSSIIFGNFLASMPMPPELSSWYAAGAGLTVATLVALAYYGFHISIGGRPLIGNRLFGD